MMFCWIIILLCLRFLRAEEIRYAQVGATVILPRYSKGEFNDIENLYVNWFIGQKNILNRNPQSPMVKGNPRFSFLPDFSLQISPVNESDFGVVRGAQYKGTATNQFTYRLHRVTTSTELAVMIKASLSLKCELEASPVSNTAKIMWIPPEASGCKLDIRPSTGSHISVVNVPMCASGVWTCSIKYHLREDIATTTVYVIDLSPAPADPIYTSVSQSVVNIPCSLSSDIPWTLLKKSGLQGGSWSFTPLDNKKQKQNLLSLNVSTKIQWNGIKGAPIAVQGREVKNRDLSILKLPVSKEIQGEYTCSLAFRNKKFDWTVEVKLLQVSSAPDPPLYEGKSVNLSCSVGPNHTNPDGLEIKWKRPSSSNSHPRLSSSLNQISLFPVRMQDKGKWTCELYKNNTRLTYAELLLKIEKAPVDIWLWVAISSGVVVFILLLVVIIIAIRRHKQMVMHRRRKTRFCCCKTPQQKGFYKT